MESSFWTSASSDGEFCSAERMFAWCTENGTVVNEAIINNSDLWASQQSGNDSAGNCVTLGLSKNGTTQLSLASCSDSKPYMCQVGDNPKLYIN